MKEIGHAWSHTKLFYGKLRVNHVEHRKGQNDERTKLDAQFCICNYVGVEGVIAVDDDYLAPC